MMDAASDSSVWKLVLMTSAQVGKTELLLNLIGYHVDYDACPILLLQPTLDMAEAFSKDRLTPMVRDTPAIRGKIKDPRARDSGNTILHKKFPGGHITMAGANSPASLASRPIRIVLADEVDRYPLSVGTEGDPLGLAEKRTTTFYNRKIIEVSTPTIKGASRIEMAWEETDQRRYHVPCPECGEFQVLMWGQVKWDPDQPETARYECAHCRAQIPESKKRTMVSNGRWVASRPFKGIAGFHISELYSPWSTWAKMAREFLQAKKSPETLKTFVNTSLGETWQEKGEAPEWQRIYERREPYKTGTVPEGVIFITAGVDVQKDRLEYELVGWGRDKQSWSIDYQSITGDTALAQNQEGSPWAKLSELMSKTWVTSSKAELPIRMMAVDTGYNTQHVYGWVRGQATNRVRAIKGKDELQMPFGTPTAVDVKIGGRKYKRGLKLWPVGVSILKGELYSWLKLLPPTDEEKAAGKGYPHGFCHHPQYSEEFFKQLTAEQLIARIVRGRTKYEWEKTRERNEALDCRVYARAAAAMFGLDRMSEKEWLSIAGHSGIKEPPARNNPPAATKEVEGPPEGPPSSRRPRRQSSFLA